MASLIYFVLFMALCISHSSASYCLCKDGVADDELQKALDYACGYGADCGPIQPNGPCYEPNTVKGHCDYAVNSYFQNMQSAGGTCDFSGATTTSPTPPSGISSGCVYPSGPGASGTKPTPTTPPSFGTPPSSTGTPNTPPFIQGPPSTDTGSTVPSTPDVFGRSQPRSKSDSSTIKATNTKFFFLLVLSISSIAFSA